MSKMLVTIAYGSYWDLYGERFEKMCDALIEKPHRILIITDKPVKTKYENVVYIPETGFNNYTIGLYRQKALDLCDCDWFIQFDIDDIMYPNYISNLKEDADWHIFSVKNNEAAMQNLDNTFKQFYELKELSFGGYMNSAYKTSMLRKIGGYKTDFGWEDIILTCDLLHNKANIFIDTSELRGERLLHNKDSITKALEENRTIKSNETKEYFEQIKVSYLNTMNNTDKIKWIGKHSYYTGPIDIINWGDDTKFVHIGNFTAISISCKIILSDGNHFYNTGSTYDFPHPKFNHKENKRPFPSRGDVIIGSDVWIGQDVTIMSGVKIGDGAVIAANSHVVKDVPPYSIYGGNPAKHIKYRFSPDIIERFIKLRWWEFPDNLIQQCILLLQKEPNIEILNSLEEILKDEYREKISTPSRYHEIAKLYITLLNRYHDWEGLKNYEYSNMSIQEIKESIMKSQEYKALNNG